MKKKYYFVALASLCVVATTSCTEDNAEYGPTTVAEDKVNIQASFDRVKNLLQNFKDGSLYKFADEFFDYHEEEEVHYYYYYVGEGRGHYSYNYNTGEYVYTYGGAYERESYSYYEDVISEFVELLGDKLENVVDFGRIERENRFNLASFAGKYTWNNTYERWDKTQHNSILANFPAASGQPNNCELALTEYADKACDIEGETIYLPTKAKAYLSKDGEKLAAVNVSASYTNYGIPQQANAEIYAKPVNITTSLKQESASRYSASVLITDETKAENNLSVAGEATLSNVINQYTDFDDCELNVLRFTVKQSDLTINGSLDAKTLNKIHDPSAHDINTCINIEVLYRNQKVGTLNVQEVGGDKYLYITYKDGTQENTSMYYDSFVEDVKEMYKKYWDAID